MIDPRGIKRKSLTYTICIYIATIVVRSDQGVGIGVVFDLSSTFIYAELVKWDFLLLITVIDTKTVFTVSLPLITPLVIYITVLRGI